MASKYHNDQHFFLSSRPPVFQTLFNFILTKLLFPNPVQEPKPYSFAYGVADEHYGPNFGQEENSDGKSVKGSYTVSLPDGRKQTVSSNFSEYSFRQLEQSPRIVSGKAPSWRFLQGAGYGGNRQPYFYSTTGYTPLVIYYVFHGHVTLLFANNSLMHCRITMKFLDDFF